MKTESWKLVSYFLCKISPWLVVHAGIQSIHLKQAEEEGLSEALM